MTPAVLVVDAIRDFFDPRGQNHYDRVAEVEAPIAALLAAARERDLLTVHGVERHRPGVRDAEQPKLPLHCAEGSFAAEFWPALAPVEREREIVVAKRRYSAFFATDLALLLHEQGVDTVIVAGVKTNVCIRATCQDAFAHGFAVVLAGDATNSNREHLEAASREDVARYLGDVRDVDEIVRGL
jgi:maleamate amidohydrolase